jgi:hypothetical protein
MIIWTDYLKYRAALRGFDLEKLEAIVRHSTERYFDTETERHVVVGRHNLQLVIIPYELDSDHYYARDSAHHQSSANTVPTKYTEIYP